MCQSVQERFSNDHAFQTGDRAQARASFVAALPDFPNKKTGNSQPNPNSRKRIKPYGKHLDRRGSYSFVTNLTWGLEIHVTSSFFLSASSSHGFTSQCTVPYPRMHKHQEQGENNKNIAQMKKRI